MPSPHPTKTRLALLQDVADGHVYCVVDGTDYNSSYAPGLPRKVNAAVGELERAGWVGLEMHGDDIPGAGNWRLTDAGREVLEAADDAVA